MLASGRWIAAASLAALSFCGTAVQAQPFPTQPIRIIIPFAPVATSDIIARTMNDEVRARLGQPFVVENRPGASTQIGTREVVQAAPDGHTLLLTASTFAVNPSLFRNLPYDSLKDLTPVTQAGATPHTLVINNDLPVQNLQELIAHAKAHPGKLSYGSVGNGSSPHMGMELLKKQTGISVTHIPYKGPAAELTDLMSGQIQLAFVNTPNIVTFVKGGRMRAIATAHPTRTAQLPEVATAAEQGLPGFASNTWFVFLAPSATPQPVLDRLNSAFVAALRSPAVRSKLEEQGVQVVASSREDATVFIRSEITKHAELVRFSGITVD
jgi:tripartite-type tricarboxylate transporter receptor subunit TctC